MVHTFPATSAHDGLAIARRAAAFLVQPFPRQRKARTARVVGFSLRGTHSRIQRPCIGRVIPSLGYAPACA